MSNTLPVPIGGMTIFSPSNEGEKIDEGASARTDVLPPIAAPLFVDAVHAAEGFMAASRADATRRAYESDWADFSAWSSRAGRNALPADPLTVASYLSALAAAGLRISTIRRRVAAIGAKHRAAGLDHPGSHAGVTATLTGIARTIGSAPRKKAALTAELLAKAVRKIPADLVGLRDRALLLLGFAAALRRSELVALTVADVERHAKGLVVHVRRSKSDQEGRGLAKAIPHGRKLNVIAALDAWLTAAGITSGPVFRGVNPDRQCVKAERLSDRQVARIVKARCAAIGLDETSFAGHSLRSGYITTADEHGASLKAIGAHVGHAKVETTAGYVQVADAFRNHSGKGFL
jgi:site-specific recombinase XerD